jgi:pimeloyl-ACP methyl ester carboxylesterase
MDNLCRLLRYLTSKDQEGCGWDLEQIHLFGWGMGGTMALELARWIGVKGLGGGTESEDKTTKGPRRLGSAISVCGPLLSTPAVSSGTLDIPTPVFYFHRPRISGSNPPSALTKTFTTVRYATGRREAKRVNEETGEDEGMLTGQDEWRQVMKFWSEVLGRGDEGWKGSGEVYEVVR